jgi:hypothetical protein
VTADSIFSGISELNVHFVRQRGLTSKRPATFAKLPWVRCLNQDKDESFDIAFIGAPFVSLSSEKMLSTNVPELMDPRILEPRIVLVLASAPLEFAPVLVV